jgi:hypothetical protein
MGERTPYASGEDWPVRVRGRGQDRVNHGRLGPKDLVAERGPGSIGFYTTGPLFLEEYYTLGVMARAGIGTNNIDGNTRLCTATTYKTAAAQVERVEARASTELSSTSGGRA